MKPMLVVQILFAFIFAILTLQSFMIIKDNKNETYLWYKQHSKHDDKEGQEENQLSGAGYGSMLLAWMLFIVLYKFVISPYKFFKQLHISSPKADPILGNLREMASVGFNKFILDNIKKFGNVFGIYIGRRPIICIADPDMLKNILVKDFDKFTNRPQIINHFKNPMDLSLTFIRDISAWKKIRSIASPAFTPSKLKQTVPLICQCLESLEANFQTAVTEKKSLDVWSAYGKFTSAVIISSAFGLSGSKHSKADMIDFNDKMEELFAFKSSVVVVDILNTPGLLRNLFNNFIGGHDVSFFVDILGSVIKERRQSGTSTRRDFLDLILTENQSGIAKLTDNEIMAQCINFLLGGYETTMNALAFSTYLLALNPDIQDRLYDEVKDQDLDNSENSLHSNIQRLEYLDQVFSEAMRCYPPAYFFMREANEDYIYNGIHLPKGIEILIPIYAIHHNPGLWEDPERFDPERFNTEKRRNIKPCAYLPFGYGPRNCIGLRFAQLEAKIALVHLVKQFKFEKSVDTEVPLSVRLGITMSATNGIYLKISARNSQVA